MDDAPYGIYMLFWPGFLVVLLCAPFVMIPGIISAAGNRHATKRRAQLDALRKLQEREQEKVQAELAEAEAELDQLLGGQPPGRGSS